MRVVLVLAGLLLGGCDTAPAGRGAAPPAPAPTLDPAVPVPAPPGSSRPDGCYNDGDCAAGEQCVGCGPPPGCAPEGPCPQVCYGTCVPRTGSAPTPTPTPTPRATGRLTINAKPWVAVWVDGKLVRTETPLFRYAIAPGRHELRFVNERIQCDFTHTIAIVEDRELVLYVDARKKTVTRQR